jgi:hypothetical protein
MFRFSLPFCRTFQVKNPNHPQFSILQLLSALRTILTGFDKKQGCAVLAACCSGPTKIQLFGIAK